MRAFLPFIPAALFSKNRQENLYGVTVSNSKMVATPFLTMNFTL